LILRTGECRNVASHFFGAIIPQHEINLPLFGVRFSAIREYQRDFIAITGAKSGRELTRAKPYFAALHVKR